MHKKLLIQCLSVCIFFYAVEGSQSKEANDTSPVKALTIGIKDLKLENNESHKSDNKKSRASINRFNLSMGFGSATTIKTSQKISYTDKKDKNTKEIDLPIIVTSNNNSLPCTTLDKQNFSFNTILIPTNLSRYFAHTNRAWILPLLQPKQSIANKPKLLMLTYDSSSLNNANELDSQTNSKTTLQDLAQLGNNRIIELPHNNSEHNGNIADDVDQELLHTSTDFSNQGVVKSNKSAFVALSAFVISGLTYYAYKTNLHKRHLPSLYRS